MFGGEGGDSRKLDRGLAGAEGVANGEDTRVKQADDVSGVGSVHGGPVLGHQLGALSQLDVLLALNMVNIHAPLKLAAADPHKGNAVPVGLVHVGLNLEDKAAELFPVGAHFLPGQVVGAGTGAGREPEKVLKERLHTKVGEGASEEDRGEPAMEHRVQIKFLGSPVQQLHILGKLGMKPLGQQLVQVRVTQGGLDFLHHLGAVGPALALESQDVLAGPVVNALEFLAAADGPVHGIGGNAQHLLNFLAEFKGVPGFPVHLVDEGEDGDVPQGTNLEQLDGLGLYAFGSVNDHDGAVRSHKGTVGVLAEILVSGGVQNVDAVTVIVELEHRAGYRNTTLLFDLHPVGDCMAGVLLSLYAARLLDGSAVKEQLLSKGGFTGVRMADNGKSAPAVDFLL